MKNKLRRLNKAAWLPLMAGTPVWAAGGGRLVATQAIAGLSSPTFAAKAEESVSKVVNYE